MSWMDNSCPEVRHHFIEYHYVESGCSSIIFKMRQDKKMCTEVSALKEGSKRDIDLWAPAALLAHSSCHPRVHTVTTLQGAPLPPCATGHSFPCAVTGSTQTYSYHFHTTLLPQSQRCTRTGVFTSHWAIAQGQIVWMKVFCYSLSNCSWIQAQ